MFTYVLIIFSFSNYIFSLENSSGSYVAMVRCYLVTLPSPSPSSSPVLLKTPSEIRRNPFSESGCYKPASEWAATAWVSENFHDLDSHVRSKEEKPGKRAPQELEKGQFVHPVEDVLGLCPPTSFWL